MIKDFGIMKKVLGTSVLNTNKQASNMSGFKIKGQETTLNVIAYLILFPILLPVMFAGLLFGLALYIFDKKNQGLGH